MMSRLNLEKLALKRLGQTRVLHDAGMYDLSCYICGYALEAVLKAAVCRNLDVMVYPEEEFSEAFKIHKPEKLLFLSGLSGRLKKAFTTDERLYLNWLLLKNWNVNFRYRAPESFTSEYSKGMIDALGDEKTGIIPWIMRNWRNDG